MDKNVVRGLEAVVATLRQIDPDMSIQTLHTLMLVAIRPRPLHELSKLVGVANSSLSLHLVILGRFKNVGPGLVDARENPDNRREKIISLTPKGEQLMETLARCIGQKGEA